MAITHRHSMKKIKHTEADTVYAAHQDMIVDFEFDDNVARVFSDMVRRSVPAYSTVITMVGLLAEQYSQVDSRCYDLGCSLGAVSLSMRNRIKTSGTRIIAVDNSLAMIQRCRENIKYQVSDVPVQLLCANIEDVPIQNASVVVLNLTLQFVKVEQRGALVQKIYDGLLPGGVLLLTEKVIFSDQQEQNFQDQMHIAFKKANAYSDLEISQKRQALENVLVPETVEQHLQRLREAGFSQIHLWCQCFNFVSILARK